MITGIAVQNFRCFSKEIRVPLGPMTFLFGPNAAGKTAILDALNQVATLCSGPSRLYESIFRLYGPYSLRSQAFDPAQPLQLDVTYRHNWGFDAATLRYRLTLTQKENSVYGREQVDIDGRVVHDTTSESATLLQAELTDSDDQQIVAGFIDWIRHLRRYRLSPALIRDKSPFDPDKRWIDPTGARLPAALDYMCQNDPHGFSRFQASLGAMFPGIQQLAVDILGDEFGLRFTNAGGRQLTGAHLSDGQAIATAVAFMLASKYAPRVLCFEEIENGFSPKAVRGLLNQLLAAAQSTDTSVSQVIASTHSPFVICWADEFGKAVQISLDGKARPVSEVLSQSAVTLDRPVTTTEACALLETFWYT